MRYVVFLMILMSSNEIASAVMISSHTYNYLWNPFTGTQQYVTSIDTTSIKAGSNITVSTTASGVSIASTGGGGVITPGSTFYIQNTNTLQSGSTFFVSSGSINGQLNVTHIQEDINGGTQTAVNVSGKDNAQSLGNPIDFVSLNLSNSILNVDPNDVDFNMFGIKNSLVAPVSGGSGGTEIGYGNYFSCSDPSDELDILYGYYANGTGFSSELFYGYYISPVTDSPAGFSFVSASSINGGIGTVTPDRLWELVSPSPQLRLTQTKSITYADFNMNSSGDLDIDVDGQTNQLLLDNNGGVCMGANIPLGNAALTIVPKTLKFNGDTGYYVNATSTAGAVTVYAAQTIMNINNGSASGGSAIGHNFSVNVNATTNIPGQVIALNTATNRLAAGTLPLQIEFQTGPAVIGGGNTTNLRQINLRDVFTNSGAGTVNTQYGLFINPMISAATNVGAIIGEASGSTGNSSDLVLGQTTIPTGRFALYSASTQTTSLNGNLTVSGQAFFVSTFSATAMNGYKEYRSSGTCAANTTVTIAIPGTTAISFPMVTELETTNTAGVSVRIKSISASSYGIYNADIVNSKDYITSVWAK